MNVVEGPGDDVTFTWDGRRVRARGGEPVAAALWRAGHVTQARSIKYHRPRGPHCFAGACSGCLVRIDGLPNQRGCRAPARAGAVVESQVGWPSARHDIFGLVDRAFSHFDHERAFVRPWIVSRVYERVARRMAGFGRAPDGQRPAEPGEVLRVDVLVAGGGPAGLGAALEAGRAGARVLLVDDDGFGGSLQHETQVVDAGAFGAAPGPELALGLAAEVAAAGVRTLHGSVFGLYEDGIGVVETGARGTRAHRVTATTTVIATGAWDGPVLLPGNDVPGVLPARAARKLLNRWGVPAGSRVAVVDPLREGTAFLADARAAGLGVTTVEGALRIRGHTRVERVDAPNGTIEADAVVVDPGLTPAPELTQQAGVPFTYEAALGGRVPVHRPDGTTPMRGVFVAGSCAGVHDPGGALMQGLAAGALAAGRKPVEELRRASVVSGLTPAERDALARVWGST